MKKVQVIGLPGSGKTTGIKLYKQDKILPSICDIKDFSSEKSFYSAIYESPYDLIAESACGILMPSTYIIKLQISKANLLDNLIKRDNFVDEFYLSILDDQLLPANYTVNSTADLTDILTTIFEK